MREAAAPGAIDSILKVSGTKIVDGNGREVILKGVSSGSAKTRSLMALITGRLDWADT